MSAADGIEIIVRGLARWGQSVLLCVNRKRGYAFLPGGHVEHGEAAGAALSREFMEETGLRVEVGPLVFVSEGRFLDHGRTRHELNLVFDVFPTEGAWPEQVESREAKIIFTWHAPLLLRSADLRPTAIARWLRGIGPEPVPSHPFGSDMTDLADDHPS